MAPPFYWTVYFTSSTNLKREQSPAADHLVLRGNDWPGVLQALVAAGCPVSTQTLCCAASMGHSKALKFLDKQGLDWEKSPWPKQRNALSELRQWVKESNHSHNYNDNKKTLMFWENALAARKQEKRLARALPKHKLPKRTASVSRM